MNDLVSVIMNCHNGEKYLKQAINSLLIQTYKNWELVFFDNCSTDNSYKIIKSYKDKRIKYFNSQKKVGLGLARKLAYKRCSGTFISFLDCDDVWFKKKINLQIKYFKNSKVGIVISNSLIFNSKRSSNLYKKEKIPTGAVFYKLLEKYFISLDTVIIRKSFCDKLKTNFRSNYNIIHDLDLLTRLSKICLLDYCPKTLSKWRVHNYSDSFNKDKIINYEKKIFIKDITKINKKDKKFLEAKKKFLEVIDINESINYLIENKRFYFIKKFLNSKFHYKYLILLLFCMLPFGSYFFKRIYHYRKLYN